MKLNVNAVGRTEYCQSQWRARNQTRTGGPVSYLAYSQFLVMLLTSWQTSVPKHRARLILPVYTKSEVTGRKTELNSGNGFCHSFPKFLSSRLLSKNVNIKQKNKSIFLSLVLYGW
jgi:hypothetical protein